MEADAEAYVTEKKADAEIKLAMAKGDIDWDIAAIKGADSSWKDEYLTIVFTIPLILCFVPIDSIQESVALGFQTLQTSVPQWYYVALGSIIGASFGLRGVAKFFQNKVAKKPPV